MGDTIEVIDGLDSDSTTDVNIFVTLFSCGDIIAKRPTKGREDNRLWR